MVSCAEFLLEDGRGIGDRFVGNIESVGDFDDLASLAQQPKNFEFPGSHGSRRIGPDGRAGKGDRFG